MHRKKKPNTVIVYGIHAVKSLIKQRPEDIITLYCSHNHNSRLDDLLAQARDIGINLSHVDTETLCRLIASHGDNDHKMVHQGIIALMKSNHALNEKQLQHDCQQLTHSLHPSYAQLWIILDNVQDPQNLGAILRHAECCACNGVIAPNHHSASLNHTVRKIASGAAELINFYQVSNLARAIAHLQQANVWTIGLDANNTSATQVQMQEQAMKQTTQEQKTHFPHDEARNLFTLDLKGNIAFILGAEGSGMRQKTRNYCDQIAYLPMLGCTPSLNVAHATTVALFETIRQRQSITPRQ